MVDATDEPIEVLDDAKRVAVLAPPLRRRLLEALEQPDSAAGLARRLDLPRQKVNYHLRELERAELVELVETRKQRGCTERIVRASARSYLIDPALLGALAETPDDVQDRFSSAYLVASAARLTRDAAVLRRRAREAGQRLATITVETEVAFASPAHLRAFSQELTAAVAALAAKYQDPSPAARPYRFVVGGHPTLTTPTEAAAEERLPGDDA